jgi:quinone-modifying oxidoreductase subunit QmoC
MKPATVIKRETVDEIVKLGGAGLFKCYQCGSCTATCAVAEGLFTSFRRVIKYAQLGIKDKVISDLVPWLCNVHGDCIKACPRDANPCEILAALRRYQSINYDWTGISAWWNYSSLKAKLVLSFTLSLITMLIISLFHGPIITEYVALDTFIPWQSLILFGGSIISVIAILLLSNAYRMYKLVRGNEKYKVGFLTSIILILRFWIKTEIEALKIPDKRVRILEHLSILIGLGLFILLTVIAILYPHAYNNLTIWIIRYIAVGALLYGVGAPLIKRLKRSSNVHWYYRLFRHSTDWTALVLVFLVALSGGLLIIFKDLGMPIIAYAVYTVHLGFVVPFLTLEIPFGKHTHWLYKLIANYVATRRGLVRGEELE